MIMIRICDLVMHKVTKRGGGPLRKKFDVLKKIPKKSVKKISQG